MPRRPECPTRWRRALLGALVSGLLGGLLSGCSTLSYYGQAAHGQLALLAGARPIDAWLADPATDSHLRQRLETARQLRRFAVQALALPDNGSYTHYAALGRPYVLWHVVATPELSLTPLRWCFPVAGCVSYRGYYNRTAALAYAQQLRAEGRDVALGGVTAYSTLGWFKDPLLSTFIDYPDAELARLIFHELAHQVSYVAGDTGFNESFASAVEEAGVALWLERNGTPSMHTAYARYSARRQDFLALLLKARRALEQTYAGPLADADKRRVKAQLLRALQDDYLQLKAEWGGYAGYDRFFAEPLSNAQLAAIATYTDMVPAFRAMLHGAGDFARFYAQVRALGQLPLAVRHATLTRWVTGAAPASEHISQE